MAAACRFKAPLLAAATLAGTLLAIPAAGAETITLQLFQLNNVYEITPLPGGGGDLARVAGLVRQLRRRQPHNLVLLAGDALSPSALGTARVDGQPLDGRQMVAVLNALGLDGADVTPFIGPGLMRVGGCGYAAVPC